MNWGGSVEVRSSSQLPWSCPAYPPFSDLLLTSPSRVFSTQTRTCKAGRNTTLHRSDPTDLIPLQESGLRKSGCGRDQISLYMNAAVDIPASERTLYPARLCVFACSSLPIPGLSNFPKTLAPAAWTRRSRRRPLLKGRTFPFPCCRDPTSSESPRRVDQITATMNQRLC